MSDATCVSSIVRNTRSKPFFTAARTPRCAAELLLDPLENQHVGVHPHADRQDEAGDAGQRHGRPEVGHQAEQDDQVEHHGDDGVDARQLVVDEHEQPTTKSSPTSDALTPARIESAPSVGPITRSSR